MCVVFYQEMGMDSGIVNWSQEKKFLCNVGALIRSLEKLQSKLCSIFQAQTYLLRGHVISDYLDEWNVAVAIICIDAVLPAPPAESVNLKPSWQICLFAFYVLPLF